MQAPALKEINLESDELSSKINYFFTVNEEFNFAFIRSR